MCVCLLLSVREEQRRLRELETQLYNIDSKMKELQKEAAMSKVGVAVGVAYKWSPIAPYCRRERQV